MISKYIYDIKMPLWRTPRTGRFREVTRATGTAVVITTCHPMPWRPTMPSVAPIPPTLTTNLRRIGLLRLADDLNDVIARATKSRWGPVALLEALVAAEIDDRARRSLERRLAHARLGRFKSLADREWDWPKGSIGRSLSGC